ncbi:MAG: hypothetical protein KBD37_07175 [Burkholderiales bacterium]|nr:hypothetical protein [Burkholderiales bacterium]
MLDEKAQCILEFLSRVGYCQERHLIKLLNLETERPTVYNKIRSLVKKDLVVKLHFLQGEDYFIMLTKTAAAQFGITPSKKLVLNTLKHDMLVLDLWLHLKHTHINSIIKTEKELKRSLGLRGVGISKVPDLLLNNEIAIEVELTAKTETRLREIINSYILKPEIVQVHYYTKSRAIINRVFKLSQISAKFKGFLFKEGIEHAVEVFPSEARAANSLVSHSSVGAFNLDEYLS